MDPRVALFARTPVLGCVKTRLARKIGDEAALACYKTLLKNTIQILKRFDTEIWTTGPRIETDWMCGLPHKPQPGGDLGEKMLAAFLTGRNIAVGSDCPDLTSEHIDAAGNKLDRFDVAIGPAEDGGYYLIGMKNARPALFLDMEWSTNHILKDTLQRAEGLHVLLLPTLWDVDTERDYRKWLSTQS